MRSLYWFGCLLTLCYFDYGYCVARCDCNVEHPQQMYCSADFAFVGTVLAAEDQRDVYVYEVELSGDKVYKGLSYLGVGTEHITVYTPYGMSLCGRPNLVYMQTYLFTGSFMEGKFMITYCNWVELWDDITDKEKEYLQTKEYLNHCNLCKIYGVKAAITVNQNDNDLHYPGQVSGLWTPYNCHFNPVSSATFGPYDCETRYSFCYPSDETHCDWKLNPEYEECFAEREKSWQMKTDPGAAAAITTVKDCRNMATRREKKKCLRLIKNHLKAVKTEPRDMLEELLDLRDMWLDDDVFDDED